MTANERTAWTKAARTAASCAAVAASAIGLLAGRRRRRPTLAIV